MTIDLHAAQIQGFFDIPVDHLMGALHDHGAISNVADDWKKDYVVVSPDHSGMTRAQRAEFLKTPIAIIDKRRSVDKMNTVMMNIIGSVEGKRILIDMIDTAGTICHAADTARSAKEL